MVVRRLTNRRAAVAADPIAFFGSESNRARAVKDLLSFVDFETLSVALMSEYVLIP